MSAPTALRRAAGLTLATAALTAAAVVGPQAASADTTSSDSALSSCAIGMVPLTNQNTWLRSQPGFTTVVYTLEAGRGFRITAGPVVADGLVWWYGHGNDTSSAWAPEQNLTCA